MTEQELIQTLKDAQVTQYGVTRSAWEILEWLAQDERDVEDTFEALLADLIQTGAIEFKLDKSK